MFILIHSHATNQVKQLVVARNIGPERRLQRADGLLKQIVVGRREVLQQTDADKKKKTKGKKSERGSKKREGEGKRKREG